jgi:alpha-galactosidase
MSSFLRLVPACLAIFGLSGPTPAQDGPRQPVKVYILSGQSNMVGIGQVDGGGSRWGDEFLEPTLSVYPGAFDPAANYDERTPAQVLRLEKFGGVSPTPFPGGGVQVVRGFLQVKVRGTYELRPGFGDSEHNVMEVAGREVYRKPVGGEATRTPISLAPEEKVPFKITYFTAGANGLGWIARLDIPGTLTTVVKQGGEFPHLIDGEGRWVSRDDVWYKGVVTATANKWLSIGCGASANSIGPELGFGHVVGDFHPEPVLLLKASQGNRSLGWDFLPPGSERFPFEGKIYAGYKDTPEWWIEGQPKKEVNWYAGKQYDDCFGEARQVLENFDAHFPHWKGRGYEIAGFVWWQGHKDGGGEPHASRYEGNLVRLIHALRKDFHAPHAPFVLGTIGFDGWNMTGPNKTVADGQLAVSGESGKYPEFKGNVKTVETRGFWPKVEDSPRNQGFHYHGNARTYMQVGEALGKAMVALQQAKK